MSALVQAGARRGLQFMAITDHNTTSHHAELMGLQEVYGNLLLIRGQELTTFHGHANIYGTSEPIDYRLGFQGYSIGDAMQAAERAGALFSINHPGRTTGETCTGCGWDAPGTDYARLRSMEVVNSTRAEGPASGAIVWHQHLNRGLRITGVGGADDHGAGSPAAGSRRRHADHGGLRRTPDRGGDSRRRPGRTRLHQDARPGGSGRCLPHGARRSRQTVPWPGDIIAPMEAPWS